MHGVLIDILGLGVLISARAASARASARSTCRPRPPPGRRRHGGNPPARRDDPHRHVPGADAPPHGGARPRRSSTSRICSASPRRARPSASSWWCSSSAGTRRASTIASASTTTSTRCSACGCRSSACRWRRAGTSRSSWRSPRAISCCGRAGITPRARSPSGSSRRCAAARSRGGDGGRPTTRRRRTSDEEKRRVKARACACDRPKATEGRPAVHRPHRPVGLRKVAGHPRARGSRLLLRRQPADVAPPDAGEAVAARRRRHRQGRHRHRRSREEPPSSFPQVFARLRKMPRLNPVLIFLEASHATLVRRFSETRRPHPLAPDRPVTEGIRDERTRLHAIRGLADEIVDTSDMTVHELRQFFMGLSRERGRATAGADAPELRLQARPAGRRRPGVRRAVPAESALRAGAAAPHRTRRAVVAFMERDASTREFMERLEDYVRYVVPHYVAEGKSYLTVAIGCTGGRHRSVMIAERLQAGARRRRRRTRARAASRHRARERADPRRLP